MGVTRIRLTGGEPTLRQDLVSLVSALSAIEGLEDLSMTTNGHLLEDMAPALAEAGLNRVNVSLDTLDPEAFAKISRGGDLERVLRGIEGARECGLGPVKINAVMLAGENEDQAVPLVETFSEWSDDIVLRFIEYMPFEVRWHQCVTGETLRQSLEQRWTLEPVDETLGGGPAVYWRIVETGLRVGFISPLSARFCGGCNRLRLLSDGHLRTCLSDDGTESLRTLLRAGASDVELAEAIRAMVQGKREGHGCEVEGGKVFEGVMTRVGG
jgi:cyclic pyranopterin phosphate synthase